MQESPILDLSWGPLVMSHFGPSDSKRRRVERPRFGPGPDFLQGASWKAPGLSGQAPASKGRGSLKGRGASPSLPFNAKLAGHAGEPLAPTHGEPCLHTKGGGEV